MDLETQKEVVTRAKDKHFILVAPNCGVFYESSPQLKKPYVAPTKLGELGVLVGKMDSGELKSLLQKLLRFGPAKVEMGGTQYMTGEVLQAVCECCLVHPGANTGLFVRGLPSFLKRLGVTMVEESWVDETILHDLFLMSIIASNDSKYFPTQAQLKKIFQGAQNALRSSRAVVYKQERAGNAIKLGSGLSLLKRASCFLDILKSFSWDLTMVRDVAQQKTLSFQSSSVRPEIMDISHYLDHHVGPEFAYFLEPRSLIIAKERLQPMGKKHLHCLKRIKRGKTLILVLVFKIPNSYEVCVCTILSN